MISYREKLKKAKVFKDWVTVHYKGKEAGKIYIEPSFIGGEKAPKTEPAAMPMGYPAGVPGAYPAAPGGYPPAPVPGYAPAPDPGSLGAWLHPRLWPISCPNV